MNCSGPNRPLRSLHSAKRREACVDEACTRNTTVDRLADRRGRRYKAYWSSRDVDDIAQLEWSPEAIAAGQAIAPFHYPLEPGLHAARSREFDGLHGFLADSLPDAWGMLLLCRRLAKLGHKWEDLNAVDRLALVGRRGRGALVFQPETLDEADRSFIDLDQLAAESRHVMLGEEGGLDALLATLGGGSGGARPKVHLSFDDKGTPAASGQNQEEWIVKFPALNDPSDIGPIEEAYAQMARAAGIVMAETRLIPSSKGLGHFATRRFDRPAPGERVHMVSLGGAVEASPHTPSLDYDGFLRATLSITRDMRDVEQAFRRMVFNVLAHNRDDHVRQHAYLMDDKGEWRLAPAFDLTFSHGPGGEHYMAVMGLGREITRAHVEALGVRHGIAAKRITLIVDEVSAAVANWAMVAQAVGVAGSLHPVRNALEAIDASFC
jgi:serine/threonine-protein kinase HipA